MMEINGAIISVGEANQISETFVTRDLMLDCSTFEQGTGRKFENVVKLQAINAKIDLLNGFQPGERVAVGFYPSGRFYEKEGERRHSQNLNLFKIQRLT